MNRVKERREALGLTQMDVAVRAGVSIATVVRLEGGDVPRLDTAQKVAAALGTNVDQLWPTTPDETERAAVR